MLPPDVWGEVVKQVDRQQDVLHLRGTCKLLKETVDRCARREQFVDHVDIHASTLPGTMDSTDFYLESVRLSRVPDWGRVCLYGCNLVKGHAFKVDDLLRKVHTLKLGFGSRDLDHQDHHDAPFDPWEMEACDERFAQGARIQEVHIQQQLREFDAGALFGRVLQRVTIVGCGGLRRVEGLGRVPHLELRDCRFLKDLAGLGQEGQVSLVLDFCAFQGVNVVGCEGLASLKEVSFLTMDPRFTRHALRSLRKVEELTVAGCHIEDPLDELLAKATHLKKLLVHHEYFLKHLVVPRHLETLELDNCHNLQTVEITPPPGLQVVEVTDCGQVCVRFSQ